MTDDKYGVLLFEEAWKQLGEALAPYRKEGSIGKYIYCNRLEFCGHFVAMTFTPKQVDNKIECKMSTWVPSSFIKFVAQAADGERAPIGFH